MTNSGVPLRHSEKLFIDGEWVSADSEDVIDVIAPATEMLYNRVAAAGKADMKKAVAAARYAFDHGPWPRLSHADRAAYLVAIANELALRASDVAQIWPNEMGIVHSRALQLAPTIAEIYRETAALASHFTFVEERVPTTGAAVGFIAHEPVGVVGAIIPWNGPIALIAHKIAPALLAGCTVVVKTSPEAPGHGLLMAEVMEKIGLPPGVFNVLTASREVSEELVKHPDVDKIAFTGSTAAGKRIASILGNRIGRSTLELGGKSAALILDDYDLEKAAKHLALAAAPLAGQICASLTRIIVSRARHDEMLEALAASCASVVVGDPFAPATEMGPVATRVQRDRVEEYIALGRRDGFTLATGGGRPRHLDRGFYVEPTVFGNVDNNSRIAQEEIFGPVLCVIPSDSEEDAIAIANQSHYGLNGCVFTNDTDRAYAVARKVRTGNVSHNGYRLDFGLGFGGVKESGVGREGGMQGLQTYLESKTILLDGHPTAT